MSEMIGAQASLLQGLTGVSGIAGLVGTAGVSGVSAADGVIPEGGFGAVLGAVMAGQPGDMAAVTAGPGSADTSVSADGAVMSGETVGAAAGASGMSVKADKAAVSGQVIGEAVSGALVGEAASGNADGSAVSGDVTVSGQADASGGGIAADEAASQSGISAAEALYDLIYGASSQTDVTMEQLFTAFTGNAPTADIFTARGAGAFVSAVQRFFSPARGEDGVSYMELSALWQGVSTDEKSAYADILSAIAGRAGVPDDEGITAGELLSFALKTAAGNAMRLPLDRKKQEKSDVMGVPGQTAAAYLAAFIAPVAVVQTAVSPEGDMADGAVSGMSDETLAAAVPNMTAVSGKTNEAVPGEAVDGDITEKADEAAGEVSHADDEDIVDFCDMLARELEAAVERESVPESRVTPADISRQAFMTRVSDPNAASFEPVSGRISQGMQPENRSQGADMAADDIPVTAEMAAVQSMAIPAGAQDIPGEADVSGTVNAYDANALADRIVYRAAAMGADGEESITLRLSPEELGEIKVTVSRRAGETSVQFVARKTESAAVIGDRAAALADALVSKGISLREISVSDMGRNAASEGGRSGQEMSYQSGRQAGGDEGGQRYSRHFYYGDEADVQPEGSQDPYYDKEANLWLKV